MQFVLSFVADWGLLFAALAALSGVTAIWSFLQFDNNGYAVEIGLVSTALTVLFVALVAFSLLLNIITYAAKAIS